MKGYLNMHKISNITNQILFHNFAIKDDYLWFCNIQYNALFKMKVDTGKISFITFLPETENTFDLYSPLSFYKDLLIIAPRNGKSIIIYDTENNNIKEIKLDLKRLEDLNNINLFTSIYAYKDSAFLFPGRYPAIVKLNLHSFDVEYIDAWYKEIYPNIHDCGKVVFSTAYVDKKGICLLPMWQDGILMKFDMNDCSFSIDMVGTDSYSNVIFDNDNIYLAYKEKNLIDVIDSDKIKKTIEISVPNYIVESGFKKIFLFNNNIYCFPMKSNMILKYDINTKECYSVKEIPAEFLTSEYNCIWDINFLACDKISDSEIMIYSVYTSSIIILDCKTDEFREFIPCLEPTDNTIISSAIAKKRLNSICFENEQFDINDYIEHINYYCINQKENNVLNYGKIVYENSKI